MTSPAVSLPARRRSLRSVATTLVKAVLTVGAFWLLLRHPIEDAGEKVPMWQAILDHIGEMNPATFWKFVVLAAATKFVGILASMYRWQLLLRGQNIELPFWHLFGSFLVGRFLGTFLPSTIGLDAYKLWDAYRFSGKSVEPATATLIEKVTGFLGLFLTYLVALPLGYGVFASKVGAQAGSLAMVTGSIAVAVVAGGFLLLFRPGIVLRLLALMPAPGKARSFVDRVGKAAAAYRGRVGLLANVALQAFLVHFCTAAMYWFTALAVGASAPFWRVTFASTIQIFGTVLSPTIAGEGAREAIQALLLADEMGAVQAVMSGALGFWAAEALTVVGVVFLWGRPSGYHPRYCRVDGQPVDFSRLAALDHAA
jgi:uncharacterized membrane protein YbhN (UPF0104 family)